MGDFCIYLLTNSCCIKEISINFSFSCQFLFYCSQSIASHLEELKYTIRRVYFNNMIVSCRCDSFTLTDDGSGKWPYGGAIEAAKSMGAKVVEKVRKLRLILTKLIRMSFIFENWNGILNEYNYACRRSGGNFVIIFLYARTLTGTGVDVDEVVKGMFCHRVLVKWRWMRPTRWSQHQPSCTTESSMRSMMVWPRPSVPCWD